MSDMQAHLLVVDDDERIRLLLQKFLIRSGFLVSTARDAAQARRLLGGLDFDRRGQAAPQVAGQADAILARHHHIQHQQVEFKTHQQAAGLGGVTGRGHKEPVADEEFLQQATDAFVVIDNQKMRLGFHHAFSFMPWYCLRMSGSIIASNTVLNPCTACGPAAR